jgi:RimJ/RimL family protein N-acetyltransferase
MDHLTARWLRATHKINENRLFLNDEFCVFHSFDPPGKVRRLPGPVFVSRFKEAVVYWHPEIEKHKSRYLCGNCCWSVHAGWRLEEDYGSSFVRRYYCMEQVSKTIKLRNGTSIDIRLLRKDDGPALLSFFKKLPEDDRLFLKEDVTNQTVINRWMEELNFDKVIPFVAEKESEIIGDATLHLNKYGWQKHVAEIRCVVSREYQKNGLGTALMRELLAHAVEKRVLKVSATMMDIQKSAQRAFERIGFKKAAELKDFVTDINGKSHNLVIMVNDVSELWKKMEDLLHYYDIRTMH